MSKQSLQKDALLARIEKTVGIELDSILSGLSGRLRKLTVVELTALERAFLLAYQDGYDVGEARWRETV